MGAEVLIQRAENLSELDRNQLGQPTVDNLLHFLPFATPQTEPMLLRGEVDRKFIGVCPVVKLKRRRCTDTLQRPLQRWLAPWLGQIVRKTTYLIDTALFGYAYESPFLMSIEAERVRFQREVVKTLQSQRDADSIWIAVPSSDPSPFESPRGVHAFEIMPMVRVDWPQGASWDQFLALQSKKRRRNVRIDTEQFTSGGGHIEFHNAPFSEPLLDAMQGCLRASERRSAIHVPYNDVVLGPGFRTQPQMACCAWQGTRLAGFMSFIRNHSTLQQCHGGFDYEISLTLRTYPRLMDASIQFALEQGYTSLLLGPLNNEAKRRVATQILPVRAYLWNRNPVDTWIVRNWFARNFQAYVGP